MMLMAIACRLRSSRGLQHGARADGAQCPHRRLSSASRDGRRSRCGEQHAGRVHLPPPPHPSGVSSRCPRAALRTNPRERRAAGAGSARGSARSGAGAERSGRWGKMEGASFGAGRAGGAVDPLDFLKQPQTILRATAWIFSIVVFGSIVNECYVNKDGTDPELHCIFNENESACSYGIAIGIIAFFGCIFFLVVDLQFQQISSVKDRKRAVLLDLGFSGFLSFLWFVAFCFLANQWQRTTMSKGVSQGADAARAAIAFSFFSIIVWVALALKALQRYRLGTDMSLFATDQFATDPNAAYPGYPTGSGIESTETYQSPPFTETSDANPKGYQVPAY